MLSRKLLLILLLLLPAYVGKAQIGEENVEALRGLAINRVVVQLTPNLKITELTEEELRNKIIFRARQNGLIKIKKELNTLFELKESQDNYILNLSIQDAYIYLNINSVVYSREEQANIYAYNIDLSIVGTVGSFTVPFYEVGGTGMVVETQARESIKEAVDTYLSKLLYTYNKQNQ